MDEFNAENVRKFLEKLREIEPKKPPGRPPIKQVIFRINPPRFAVFIPMKN